MAGTALEDGLPPESDAATIIVPAFALLAGKRIFDIGCGTGVLAGFLSARGPTLPA